MAERSSCGRRTRSRELLEIGCLLLLSLSFAVQADAAFQLTWAVLHGLISLQLEHPDYSFSPALSEMALEMIERGLLSSQVSRQVSE